MSDDVRRVIEPALQIALERMATGLQRRQAQLPLWVYELLEQYGEACANAAIKWTHERTTVPARPQQQITATDWDGEETPTVDQWPEDK